MAPSTNIGAAHPVQMGGGAPGRRNDDWDELKRLIEDLREAQKGAQENPEGQENAEPIPEEVPAEGKDVKADESPMESKILNDTVAFIKAIAKERNRNVEWAVESVAQSDSITSEEALEKGVIEIIADSDRDLLKQLDGRRVQIDGREVVLNTKEAMIETISMDSRQKFFNVLANPNIAYFLMILGFYGLLFEVTHPGFGVPGVLGLVFLIAEPFTPTFGVLTLGGLACLILGSLLLFESVDPIMRVSKSMIMAFSLTTAAITLFLVRSVIMAHRAKVHGGQEGLIGTAGEAQASFQPGEKGKVFVHGELWNAISDEAIEKEDEIIVEQVEGLILKVRKK
jgi:membrane-bound serine protease (ClpP class)